MEIKDLQPIVIGFILLGLLIGTGVLIFDNFSAAAYQPTTINNESITLADVGVNNSLAHGNITQLIYFKNATDAVVPTSEYTLFPVDGKIQLVSNGTCDSGDTCYVAYKYKEYNTETAAVMSSNITSLSDISSTWINLLVVVAVLSIILVIVIKSFGRL